MASYSTWSLIKVPDGLDLFCLDPIIPESLVVLVRTIGKLTVFKKDWMEDP